MAYSMWSQRPVRPDDWVADAPRDYLRQIRDDPAFREILSKLTALYLAGIDVNNPEILNEAVRAGRADHANATAILAERRRRQVKVQSSGEQVQPGHVVYYVRLGPLCKIGVTTNLKKRMEGLNPEEILATEPGGPLLERVRHKQFADLHHHGEWFRYEPPLQQHVAQLKESPGAGHPAA